MIAAHLEPRGLSPHAKPLPSYREAGSRRVNAETGSANLLAAILAAAGHKLPPPPQSVAEVVPLFKRPPKMRRGPKNKVYRSDARAERIVQLVAGHFRLDPDELLRPNRKLAFPRQVAMYLMRQRLHLSYPEVAFQFWRMDHTTVIHGVRVIHRLLELGDAETIHAIEAGDA